MKHPGLYISISALLLLSGCNPSSSDPIPDEPKLEKVYYLPGELAETSGIIIYDSLVWTFNDSGNEPALFGIGISDSAVKKKIFLQNALNTDWEDITQDEITIYIGDIGNSSGDRDFLTIYLLSKDSITSEPVQYLSAPAITFNYAFQENFVCQYHNTEYDCEALFSMGDSLFILTKDWISQNTALFGFPKNPGHYPVETIADFDSEGLVTGASYSAEENQLAICGYDEFIPFIILMELERISDFKDPRFARYDLYDNAGLQIEGIDYDGSQICLSSELSSELQSFYHFTAN